MKWPQKREGACSNAPIPKPTTGLPQSNSGGAITQHVCGHGTTRGGLMPQGHTHHAREVCTAAWGVDGFTLTDKDAAFAKLREICR